MYRQPLFGRESNGTDVGLEASLLHNRLYVEADWYNKKTEDAIFDIPVLGSVGTTSGAIIGNQATFQNQGFEFLVTWKDNIGKDWSYSISANAGFNQNKVLEVATGGNPIYQYLGAVQAYPYCCRTTHWRILWISNNWGFSVSSPNSGL